MSRASYAGFEIVEADNCIYFVNRETELTTFLLLILLLLCFILGMNGFIALFLTFNGHLLMAALEVLGALITGGLCFLLMQSIDKKERRSFKDVPYSLKADLTSGELINRSGEKLSKLSDLRWNLFVDIIDHSAGTMWLLEIKWQENGSRRVLKSNSPEELERLRDSLIAKGIGE